MLVIINASVQLCDSLKAVVISVKLWLKSFSWYALSAFNIQWRLQQSDGNQSGILSLDRSVWEITLYPSGQMLRI